LRLLAALRVCRAEHLLCCDIRPGVVVGVEAHHLVVRLRGYYHGIGRPGFKVLIVIAKRRLDQHRILRLVCSLLPLAHLVDLHLKLLDVAAVLQVHLVNLFTMGFLELVDFLGLFLDHRLDLRGEIAQHLLKTCARYLFLTTASAALAVVQVLELLLEMASKNIHDARFRIVLASLGEPAEHALGLGGGVEGGFLLQFAYSILRFFFICLFQYVVLHIHNRHHKFARLARLRWPLATHCIGKQALKIDARAL